MGCFQDYFPAENPVQNLKSTLSCRTWTEISLLIINIAAKSENEVFSIIFGSENASNLT